MTSKLSILLPICCAVMAAVWFVRPTLATECENPATVEYLNQHLMCDQLASGRTCDGLNHKQYSFANSKAAQSVRDKLQTTQNEADKFYVQTLLDYVVAVNAQNLFVISMPHATDYNETIKRYECSATLTFDKDNYRKYMLLQFIGLLPTTEGSKMSVQMAELKGDAKSMQFVVGMYSKLLEQKLEQIDPTFEMHYSIQDTDNGTLIQYQVPNITPIN